MAFRDDMASEALRRVAVSEFWARCLLPPDGDPDACWGWEGPHGCSGSGPKYPVISVDTKAGKRWWPAMHVSLMLKLGRPCRRDRRCGHRCGEANRECVNPNHLFEMTPASDARESVPRRRRRAKRSGRS